NETDHLFNHMSKNLSDEDRKKNSNRVTAIVIKEPDWLSNDGEEGVEPALEAKKKKNNAK
ncbi:hypothetical protein CHS0354_032704, partial [Potamilus streckersoni]